MWLNLILGELQRDWIRYAVEGLILSLVIYYLLLLLRGTRAMHVLRGLLLLLLFFLVVRFAELNTIHYIMRLIFPGFIVFMVIIFQQEIRRGLAVMGQRRLLRRLLPQEGAELVDEVVKASHTLSQKRIGGLIVIEQDASLARFIEGAVKIDSLVSAKLLATIFTPYTPLHDGAVIIAGGRIAAAAALLPLTEKTDMDPELGTRHRAAVGLSEEMDSIVIVISEEKGTISLALHGELMWDLGAEGLRRTLNQLLGFEKETKSSTVSGASDVAAS
jgi:diadenylate cyclase